MRHVKRYVFYAYLLAVGNLDNQVAFHDMQGIHNDLPGSISKQLSFMNTVFP